MLSSEIDDNRPQFLVSPFLEVKELRGTTKASSPSSTSPRAFATAAFQGGAIRAGHP